ncbi:unnamed protein product [Discosporangium mesarthrocarpum]
MSYIPNTGSGEAGRRHGGGFPVGVGSGAAAGRATGGYGMPQYGQQAEPYGGPPQSPVIGGWDGGRYVSGLEETGYIRADTGVHPGSTTSLGGSSPSANGDGAFLLPGGGTTMGAALPSYYPASAMYGVPPSAYYHPASYSGSGTGAAGGYYGTAQDSYARSTNPGQPIQTTSSLQGPDGCNLFVFHIPNTMTNDALFRLFSKFGNVISARIMVEKTTGRSRGYGFVSYDNRDSAEKAIAQMNGYQIEHKRLKVQHKKEKERDRYHTSSPGVMNPAMGQGRGQGMNQGGVVTPRGAGRSFHPPFRPPLLPHQHHQQHAPQHGQHSGIIRHPHQAQATTPTVSEPMPSVSGTSVSVPVQGERDTPSDRLEDTNTKEASVGYRLPEDGNSSHYLVHGSSNAAPSSNVGGSSRQTSGGGQPRPRSASPGHQAGAPVAHQTLEHAMQTKLTIGGPSSPAPAATTALPAPNTVGNTSG